MELKKGKKLGPLKGRFSQESLVIYLYGIHNRDGGWLLVYSYSYFWGRGMSMYTYMLVPGGATPPPGEGQEGAGLLVLGCWVLVIMIGVYHTSRERGLHHAYTCFFDVGPSPFIFLSWEMPPVFLLSLDLEIDIFYNSVVFYFLFSSVLTALLLFSRKLYLFFIHNFVTRPF